MKPTGGHQARDHGRYGHRPGSVARGDAGGFVMVVEGLMGNIYIYMYIHTCIYIYKYIYT